MQTQFSFVWIWKPQNTTKNYVFLISIQAHISTWQPFSSLHMESITDFSSFEAKLWDFCATLWFIIRIYLYVDGKFRDKWAWEHCGCSNGPTWPNFWQNWQNTSGIQLSDKIHFEFKFIFSTFVLFWPHHAFNCNFCSNRTLTNCVARRIVNDNLVIM